MKRNIIIILYRYSVAVFALFVAILAVSATASCSGSDDYEKVSTDSSAGDGNGSGNSATGGATSGYDIDPDWKSWTLPENAFSWPESKRIAESKAFSYATLPKSKTELTALCDKGDGLKQRITSPQMAVALCCAALCNYQNNPETTKSMYRWLKGPEGVSTQEWQNISTRLKSKPYITFAFFGGAKPLNDYKPSVPYVIEPYTQKQGSSSVSGYIDYGTYTETDGVLYCKVFVKSGGADSAAPIMTKFHRASGNWFINGSAYTALTDIRTPASQGSGY